MSQKKARRLGRAYLLIVNPLSFGGQKRHPAIVEYAGKFAEEHDKGGLERLMTHLHVGLFGGEVAFARVAAFAGGEQVIPVGFATPRFGHYVVEGQVIGRVTILAPVAIALKNILSGQHNAFVGQVNVPI